VRERDAHFVITLDVGRCMVKKPTTKKQKQKDMQLGGEESTS